MRFPYLPLGLTALLLLPAGCNRDRDEPDIDVSETVEPEETAAPAGTGADTTADPAAVPPTGLLMPDEAVEGPATEPEEPQPTAPTADTPSAASSSQALPAADATPDSAQTPPPATPREPLVIGSKAPPLDIEHWVQMGQEGAEPVTQFEEGKVYVVEFWATWCGPCLASMPHLAETQQKYGDKVRIVSVSDEPLKTVETFLKRPAPSEEDPDLTYGQLTSAYSLTTDPDESVYDSYMRAADQNGIPTAFIVGKSGHVEWIGHPMRMDEPLDAVVKGSWDREAYAAQFLAERRVQETKQKIFRMAQQGRTEEALTALDKALEEAEMPQIQRELKQYKWQLLVGMGDRQDEVNQLGQELLEQASGDITAINEVTWLIYQAADQGGVPDNLVAQAISAGEVAVKDLEKDDRAYLLDTVAHLHEVAGNLDAAIAAQQEAVEAAESDRYREQMQEYLDELKEAKAELQGDADKKDEPQTDAQAEAADKPATTDEPAEAAPSSDTSEQPAVQEVEAEAEESETP